MNKTAGPNILFLMTDQMQANVLEEGHPCLTPNFDRLAEEGVTFTRAYTPNAVCSPARASLMTGLLPHNHGVLAVTHTSDEDQNCLRTDKPHWAQKLREAGYRTGYFGKWHVERTNRLELFGWETAGAERGGASGQGSVDAGEIYRSAGRVSGKSFVRRDECRTREERRRDNNRRRS